MAGVIRSVLVLLVLLLATPPLAVAQPRVAPPAAEPAATPGTPETPATPGTSSRIGSDAGVEPALTAVPAAEDAAEGAVPTDAETGVEAEEEVRLDSPRATVSALFDGFARLRRTGDPAVWDEILATLQAPPDMSVEDQRASAQGVYDALNRLGEVAEGRVPDEVEVRLRGLTSYTYFPGHPEQAWVWEELKAFGRWPEGEITLVRIAPEAWRFSQRTVEQAPALAESLRPLPPKYFATLADEEATDATVVANLLGPTFTLTRWWGWLALLGAIFAGLAVGRIVRGILDKLAERWRRAGWPLRATAFEAVGNPLSLALLTLGLQVGLLMFIHLGDTAPFVFSVLKFLYLIAVGWLLWNLVSVIEIALHRVTARTNNRVDDMVVPLVRRTLRIFLFVIFTLFVAQNVFGLNITGWLAGLGIAGLAVSLAAQDSVKNLFGWATVLFDRPFAAGDFISYGGTVGTVEDIGFRSTKLRMITGHLFTIPNMKWIDNTVENISARGFIRRDVNIRLAYGTSAARVEEAVRIVEDILYNDPEVVADLKYDPARLKPQVHFDDLRDDALNLKVYYYYVFAGDRTRDYNAWLRNSQLVNLKILQRFEEAGLEFALPSRTLLLAGDPSREMAVRVAPPGGASAAT